jgi:outer membrane protein assembly factor BamD (BamD/ComL family)
VVGALKEGRGLKRELAATLMIGLLGCTVACHKHPAPPGVPVPAEPLKQGEISFEKANFGQAVAAYEDYLRGNPDPKVHDRVLFRLALAYAIPGHASYNPARSTELFGRLVALFPQSPLKPQAEYILRLQAESENLKAGVKERDERIRLLREELDKLKKIDLERRPSRPSSK